MKTQADKLLPKDCANMADVRAGVDAVDVELVTLLAQRFGYMAAAAQIKSDRTAVRDEDRKARVIANAVARAAQLHAPADRIAVLWDMLVEQSIAYEMELFDAK